MSLIQIEHLYFTYDGGSEPVFEDLDLQLETDWKLGLVGRNGRGKTTLLRLLEGGLEYRGQIRTGGLACRRFPCAVRESCLPNISATAAGASCLSPTTGRFWTGAWTMCWP